MVKLRCRLSRSAHRPAAVPAAPRAARARVPPPSRPGQAAARRGGRGRALLRLPAAQGQSRLPSAGGSAEPGHPTRPGRAPGPEGSSPGRTPPGGASAAAPRGAAYGPSLRRSRSGRGSGAARAGRSRPVPWGWRCRECFRPGAIAIAIALCGDRPALDLDHRDTDARPQHQEVDLPAARPLRHLHPAQQRRAVGQLPAQPVPDVPLAAVAVALLEHRRDCCARSRVHPGGRLRQGATRHLANVRQGMAQYRAVRLDARGANARSLSW